MTPARIIAPVGSEVVVLAGVCAEDGHYIVNQPLEWMVSRDSVGQIVEVGGMEHQLFNQLVKPSAEKLDGDYARGRTALKPKLITRGTETPVDDLQVSKGQAWLSLSSASQGTTYLTCVAPKSVSWPERKSTTRIHWVDAVWGIPLPSSATAGTIHPLAVTIHRSTDGTGLAGWKVRYQIVGGVPAEFHPQGTQAAEVVSNAQGQAALQIRQPAGQAAAGVTQIRVDVVRPPVFGENEIVLESGITSVTWSSPELTIRAIGPRAAGINEPVTYRLEIYNPGDQVARDVIVSTNDVSGGVRFISSNPKPSTYGDRMEWALGNILPGSVPQVIQLQVSTESRGPLQLCFDVASAADQLKTNACAETQIEAPCIALTVNGPDTANVGDRVEFDFDVANDCNESLEDVVVRIQYDPGLQATGMSNPIEADPIPLLQPGETKNIPTLEFQALRAGTHGFLIEVTAKGGHIARSQQYVEVQNVVNAQVNVEMESHQVVVVGEQVLVRMRVTNSGNVPLDQLTLLSEFSRSMTPVRRSPGDQFWINDDLAFRLGRLDPGQVSVVEILFDTTAVDGDAYARASVSSPSGATDRTGVGIRIEPPGAGAGGQPEPPVRIPGDQASTGTLQVQVTALDRTIAVGDTASFRVTVSNDRNVPDQQIVIALLIPPGTQLVQPDVARIGLRGNFTGVDQTEFRFEPRLEMRAGELLDFNIQLIARQPGQPILRAQAISALTPNPVAGQDTVVVQ